jgi:HEAT repeat protein
MNRPSLLANPIMGLTNDRSRAIELLAFHRHVYFSDLRALTAAGMTLTGRLFYGCWVVPGTFVGARLADTCFACCAGAGEPPVDAQARRAIEDGQRGDWDRAWALLDKPEVLASEVVEHLVAVAAVGMTDARMEIRLRAMTRVARLLREHPAVLLADAREVLQAFLLYRAADDSDMVYHDAVALVDELKPSASVLEHLIGRARSPDPRERIEALVARRRMHLGVSSIEPPYPPLAELLDDDDPDVQLALLLFLGQVVRYSWDAEALLPGIDLAEKLNPLLRSRDDRVRRAAIHYAHDLGGSANREALIDTLRDPDETLRNVAFDALYLRLPEHEVRDFLLHHEATPAQRAIVLEHEARWREREYSFSRIADTADLRAMLASDDPRQRRDALLLAGFTGDPALAPDIEAALGDADPRVRAEAERLLRQLRGDQAPG